MLKETRATRLVKSHGLTFRKPARLGDTVEIVSLPAAAGTTSVTVGAEVFVNDDEESTIRGFATFVVVDKDGRPRPHGLVLPPDWSAAHAALCAEASRLPR